MYIDVKKYTKRPLDVRSDILCFWTVNLFLIVTVLIFLCVFVSTSLIFNLNPLRGRNAR